MAAHYPMPAYHFTVNWGGTRTGFSEVSGLESEVEVSEYREGSDPSQHARKMPGLQKFGNIVLKRGIMKGDNEFFAWMNTIQLNTVERRDITISLLDENHAPIMVWQVRNAFPIKYSGPILVANSSEIAIEELVLTHEGITVQTV